MEDAADHLAHDVFREVPVRQWVLSFPRSVRFLAARRPEVPSGLLDLFTRAVFAWQRRRARALRVADPRTGGCTAVQRFGGALNLNVHFHTLVPDGVFELLPGGGPAGFVYLDPPSDEDVRAVLARIVRRTAKLLAGLDLPDPGAEEDALAALQAASVDQHHGPPADRAPVVGPTPGRGADPAQAPDALDLREPRTRIPWAVLPPQGLRRRRPRLPRLLRPPPRPRLHLPARRRPEDPPPPRRARPGSSPRSRPRARPGPPGPAPRLRPRSARPLTSRCRRAGPEPALPRRSPRFPARLPARSPLGSPLGTVCGLRLP
jgi:hypothetical protein